MSRPWIAVLLLALLTPPLPGKEPVEQNEFLYGATVYPEFLTPQQRIQMLDEMQRAHMNVIRVGESSWGSLETAPGKYNFGWLREFLDEMARRKMKAILGTATYISPQWLTASHPEALVQMQPGVPLHPMYRHAACLNHPLFREASVRYIRALAAEFKNNPAVIAWQLDNEIEFMFNVVCHNPACERAWKDWLKKNYHTPEEFNRRLDLKSWANQVVSLDEIPLPSKNDMGDAKHLPTLTLAHRRFRRDTIVGILQEQQRTLREAGVRQPITHDFFPNFPTLADDPGVLAALDITSYNFYPPAENAADSWVQFPWYEDISRSALGLNHFWVTETRFGNATADGTAISEPAPTREQQRMWCLQSTALGGTMMMFWSGNRWRGGPWPEWGALFDWSGHPEPDFEWAVELGEFCAKWGKQLIENPVVARAAVLTDFEQRLALQIFPHHPDSTRTVAETFDTLHRLGIGADSITVRQATNPTNLQKYPLVVIPAATALDGPEITAGLETYVRNGGRLVILPFTSYQDMDGIYRGDGFGANLSGLTGTVVRTVRRVRSVGPDGPESPRVFWENELSLNPPNTWKQITSGESAVALGGFCEFMEVKPEAQVIARFESGEKYLQGRPAATVRKLGDGLVIRLAFWPDDQTLPRLYSHLLGGAGVPLESFLPKEVLAVPRADGSMFVANTGEQRVTVRLTRSATDRISGEKVQNQFTLGAFGVVWLE